MGSSLSTTFQQDGKEAAIVSFAASIGLSIYFAHELRQKRTLVDIPESCYDFIVVGGGSAGCALASRLSENPQTSVLLIEAGDNGLRTGARIPAMVGDLQHTDIDWEDYAEAQGDKACTHLRDGKSYWPRGKCLGGSSVLNYMAYVRGNSADFDSWANILSDSKWGWESVSKIFEGMEDCSTIPVNDGSNGMASLDDTTSGRGLRGPMSVSVKSPINPIAASYCRAAVDVGFSLGDYNGASQEVASVLQTTAKFGRRHTSADGYIWPFVGKRDNLHVLLKGEVSRVLFEHSEDVSTDSSPVATGVEVFVKSAAMRVHAKKEVVLSASAIGSPKLLLLSGVGPKEDLEKLNIPVVLHSPDVGKNLTDHIVAGFAVNGHHNPRHSGTVNEGSVGVGTLYDWMFNGKGNLASTTYDTTAFYKSGINPDMPFPDVQLGCMSACFPKRAWVENVRIPVENFVPDEMLTPTAQGLMMLGILLHPHSSGSMTIRSADHRDPPIIQPNYLSDEGGKDIETLVAAAKKSLCILKKMGYKLEDVLVHDDLKHLSLEEDESWRQNIRRYASTLYHPAGTCAMGRVLDSNLRVKGIKHLRVADASAFPHLTSGNTNAPCIMMGEMAALILKEEHKL